jgi:hypothetical protein
MTSKAAAISPDNGCVGLPSKLIKMMHAAHLKPPRATLTRGIFGQNQDRAASNKA